jgi:hypothetical protein
MRSCAEPSFEKILVSYANSTYRREAFPFVGGAKSPY